MEKPFDIFAQEAPDILAVHWGWPIALGVALVVLGVLAVWRAGSATRIAVRFLGFIVLLAGISVLAFAFSLAGYWVAFVAHVFWALLIAITGLVMLTRPGLSAEALTLMIAFYFIAFGIFEIGFAFFSRVESPWLFATEGLVTAGLGLLLLVGWPFSGIWVIGTFVGIDLIFKGVAIVALGIGLRAISEG